MEKLTVRQNAKINLTLDVIGKEGNFHNIRSLFAPIDVFDTITVKKREDNEITLKEVGLKAGCKLEDNNVYKAAALYVKTYHTCGVDIIIDKKIPVAGGLGGSSADTAGVLKCLQKIFGFNAERFAGDLGSDVFYMLRGGTALVTGRGEKVKQVFIKKKFYVLLVVDNRGISAKDSYEKFDDYGLPVKVSTDNAIAALQKGRLNDFYETAKNDLYFSSSSILKGLDKTIKDVKKSGANLSQMSGSGATVYGLFEKKGMRNKAYKLLKEKYGDRLVKTKTIIK